MERKEKTWLVVRKKIKYALEQRKKAGQGTQKSEEKRKGSGHIRKR